MPNNNDLLLDPKSDDLSAFMGFSSEVDDALNKQLQEANKKKQSLSFDLTIMRNIAKEQQNQEDPILEYAAKVNGIDFDNLAGSDNEWKSVYGRYTDCFAGRRLATTQSLNIQGSRSVCQVIAALLDLAEEGQCVELDVISRGGDQYELSDPQFVFKERDLATITRSISCKTYFMVLPYFPEGNVKRLCYTSDGDAFLVADKLDMIAADWVGSPLATP